jgi:Tfp pilus assembly protein PilF
LEEYKEVLFHNADFPTGKVNLANFYYNQEDLDGAEKFFKAALEQDNELTSVNLNLAYLYNSRGENQKAEARFREYLKERPDDTGALFSFALLLSEMGHYEASLDTLLSVRQKAPESPRVNHNIGMMYDFMNDKEKAEEFLKREIEVNKNLNSLSALLQFYLDYNYGEKALELGRKILEEYPEAAGIQQVVERLQVGIGRK